jgi:hypothetical protein
MTRRTKKGLRLRLLRDGRLPRRTTFEKLVRRLFGEDAPPRRKLPRGVGLGHVVRNAQRFVALPGDSVANLEAVLRAELDLEEQRRGAPYLEPLRSTILAVRGQAAAQAWAESRAVRQLEQLARGRVRSVILDPNPWGHEPHA